VNQSRLDGPAHDLERGRQHVERADAHGLHHGSLAAGERQQRHRSRQQEQVAEALDEIAGGGARPELASSPQTHVALSAVGGSPHQYAV
jgi:hypothetical protein